MKTIVVLLSILVVATAATYEKIIKEEWELYKTKFGKSYDSPAEESRRMNIFAENKYIIYQHNLKYERGEVSFQLGINKFSDMRSEEVDDLYSGFNRVNRMKSLLNGEESYIPEPKGKLFVPTNDDLPSSVDWASYGAVTGVRSQGNCGSCYAFAALAAIEGRVYLKDKNTKIQALSVQNVIDCSEDFGNNGCSGGLAMQTYDYILDNKGLNNETVYPYEAREGKCRYKPTQSVVQIKGYYKVTPHDEQALKAAVAEGPVSASFDASPPSFKHYKSGIYNETQCKPNKLSHAMLIVGYDTDRETGEEYWLIKNSWGTDWGEAGYMKLARNANNMCGVATRPVFPDV